MLLDGTNTTTVVRALPHQKLNRYGKTTAHVATLDALLSCCAERAWEIDPAVHVMPNRSVVLLLFPVTHLPLGLQAEFVPYLCVESHLKRRNRYYGLINDTKRKGVIPIYRDDHGKYHSQHWDARQCMTNALEAFVIKALNFRAVIDGLRRCMTNAWKARQIFLKATMAGLSPDSRYIAICKEWFDQKYWKVRDNWGYPTGSAWNVLRIFSLIERRCQPAGLPNLYWKFHQLLHKELRHELA